MTLTWLVVIGACGSRNQLPGGLAVDDDDGDVTDGVGGNTAVGNSGGPDVNTARAAIGSAISTVGDVSSGVISSTQANVSFGSIGSTTGAGGSETCDFDDNAGGEGGGAGAPDEPTSCEINFCNGWAPREGNCANIQGGFYTYADDVNGGASTAYFTSSTVNQVCVAGDVGVVIDGQYDVYWGAGFGMNLNQYENTGGGVPYDADYYGVTGFGFWLNGYFYDGELRFEVRGEDDYYCETVSPVGGYHEFSLADLIKGCWDPVGTPHDYSRLRSLEWHFVPNAQFSYYFDVCLSGLTVYR